MGSTGSGSFSDYHSFDGSGSEPGKNGGASGEDQCIRAFSTFLDEVSSNEFYKKTHTVPIEGIVVSVIFRDRLLVVDNAGTGIGYLPTKYNYLRACMNDGFIYEGIISKSSIDPIPSVKVDIMPNKK